MKTYLLLLPLLCFGMVLSAQETSRFDEAQEATTVYRYAQISGPYAPSIRAILKTLQPQKPQQAALDIYYHYRLRILENDLGLKSCLFWEAVETTRAPQPYGFTFEDILQPTGVIYNLDLLADGETVATKCVEQSFGPQLPDYVFDFTGREGGVYYTLRVRDLKFKFEQRQVQKVQARIRTIDQYRLAEGRLTALHLSLQAFRQLDPLPQQLESYRRQVRSYEDQLNRITGDTFWRALYLHEADAYDPQNLRALVVLCQTEIDAWKQWLNELAANLHLLYFEQGVAAYEQGDRHAAYAAFHASLRTDDCYAPSHYYLAHLEFEDNDIQAAGDRITRVLNQYHPDAALRLNAEQLASSIVRIYLDAGQHAVSLRQYPESVAAYERALAFSEGIRDFPFGRAEARSRIQEAYTFDFHDRLDRVVRTQQTGDHVSALQELETVLDFQERFRVNTTYDTRRLAAEIVNDLYADRLTKVRTLRYDRSWGDALTLINATELLLADYRELLTTPQELVLEKERVLVGKYRDMLAQAEVLLENGQMDAALAQAEDNLRFAHTHRLADEYLQAGRQLVTRVQQQRYERFVQGGDRARRAGDYSNALEQYTLARQLEANVPDLRPQTTLRDKLTTTALMEAERIQKLALKDFANDNDQLQNAANELHTLADRYGLRQEPEFQPLVGQLQDRQCLNARDLLLPAEEQRLTEEQDARDYLAARATLQRIQALLDRYPACTLDDGALRNNEVVVNACATYQEHLAAAEQAERANRFGVAIEQYVAAAVAYQDAAVPMRLAAHPALELYDYVRNHEDYRMTQAGGQYYIRQKEHQRALSLLQLLIDRGIEPRLTRHFQLQLGSALATQHYVATANWKTTFYGFVAKEARKPYRELYRSFRKQWKRMA